MSYARGTTNYNLPLTQGSDKRDWSDTNTAFTNLDAAVKTANDTASSASSAASTAQTRADSAYTLASTANTAAGNAATAAATAGEMAPTAKNKADTNATAIGQINSKLATTHGTLITNSAYWSKSGNVAEVTFTGSVGTTFNANGWTSWITLPAELRPTETVNTVCSFGGADIGIISIGTNGVVNVFNPAAEAKTALFAQVVVIN